MILATAESLIGSIWAVLAAGCIGYIVGHLFPFHIVAGWFRK